MPFANSSGYAIHYELVGNGPPLILQHGFSGTLNRWRWSGYVDALKDRFNVILVDARGHGSSDKPHDPAAYSLEAQASDIAAVLEDLGIKRAHYWGFSMGGRIAFAMAKYQRNRVHTLVIGGAHPFARKLATEERLDGSDPELFVNRLYRRTGIDLQRLPAEMYAELFANDFQALAAIQGDWPSLEEVLPTMTMPCLLYVGDADPYLAKVTQCAKAIPGAEYFFLPGLDHGTGFRESSLVLPRIISFLESNPLRNPLK